MPTGIYDRQALLRVAKHLEAIANGKEGTMPARDDLSDAAMFLREHSLDEGVLDDNEILMTNQERL